MLILLLCLFAFLFFLNVSLRMLMYILIIHVNFTRVSVFFLHQHSFINEVGSYFCYKEMAIIHDLIGSHHLHVKCCKSETVERTSKTLTEALGPLSVSPLS